MLGIQKLLKDEPNIESPAQQEPLTLYKTNKDEYIKKVKAFAANQKKKTGWKKVYEWDWVCKFIFFKNSFELQNFIYNF